MLSTSKKKCAVTRWPLLDIFAKEKTHQTFNTGAPGERLAR
jgi:hypothetical protein